MLSTFFYNNTLYNENVKIKCPIPCVASTLAQNTFKKRDEEITESKDRE